jgi:hypothetical protein
MDSQKLGTLGNRDTTLMLQYLRVTSSSGSDISRRRWQRTVQGREKKNLSTVSESDHGRSQHLNPGPQSVWKDHTKDTYRNSNFVIFT